MMYGTYHQVSTYVEQDVYDFLCKEKRSAPMSAFMRNLLKTYKEAVLNDEQDPNVN